jgi:hypothetical protein
MVSTKLASIGLAASLAAVLPAIPAHATLLTRTFVSSAGNDSNPCTITAPCASFAHAYSLTATNGIVAALDPGKYGPISITGPITINGNGWAAITAPATANGISISAGSGNVTLTGLNIDGAAAAYNGIAFSSGSSLTVINCVLQNFVTNGNNPVTGNGILIAPSSGTVNFTVVNTTASNNGYAGVEYLPAGTTVNGNGIIDHVVATADQYGIVVDSSSTMVGTTVATISNSIASDHSQTGVLVKNGSATVTVSVDNVTMSGNNVGIAGVNSPRVLLGRSVITGNATGVLNSTSSNSFYTYKDNRINLNTTTDVTSALNTTLSVQ